MIDFGLAKQGMGYGDLSTSIFRSVCYQAPEMLRREAHSRSIDWYLLGTLIYEMSVGVPPFWNKDHAKLFENIKSGPLKIPSTMEPALKSLVLALMNRNPNQRLGSDPSDAEEVKSHEFFRDVDWELVAAKKYPVRKPQIK